METSTNLIEQSKEDEPLQEVIERIKKGEPLQDIVFSFLPSAEQELLKRCAAVRSFDKRLFEEELLPGLEKEDAKRLSFDELLSFASVERLPRTENLYRIEEGARRQYFKQWWRTASDGPPPAINEVPPRLRELSEQLVTFYEELGPQGQLDTLYHLIAVNANEAATLFKELYRKADEDFDRALCYDLLNILEQRLPILSPKLSELYSDYLVYYRARGLWVNEYHQSTHYLVRQTLRNEFEKLIREDRWILNLYGRGGMGKTMFVRWLVARRSAADRAKYLPCARIDFDDSEAIKWAEEPLRLYLEICEQLNKQIKGGPLYEPIKALQEYQTTLSRHILTKQTVAGNLSALAARDERVVQFLDDFVSALVQSGFKAPVIIILETLEKLVVHQKISLLPLLDQIAALHARYPGLRLILSGRINLEEKLPDLTRKYRSEMLVYELKKFSEEEARGYLRHKRNLRSRNPIGAIVKKANGNPFKLTLFADLVKADPKLDAGTVMSFQSSTMADLIFRVIEGVRDRRVQWLLQYGVVPRELSFTFLKEILAPYLRAAMNGSTPQLESTEEVIGADDAWIALCQYAIKHAWVSFVAGKSDTLKFHEEVVIPMRRELQKDAVFIQLQKVAFDYFDAKAAQDPANWGIWMREAIYHKFQLEGAAADAYWQRQIASEIAERNPHWRLALAKEVLGPDYIDEEEQPLKRLDNTPLIYRKTLVRAYYEKARALVHLGNLPSNASIGIWNEADADCRWIELLQNALSESVIPPAQLAVLRAKINLNQLEYEEARKILDKALTANPTVRERVDLEAEYGDLESALGRDDEALRHYESALAQVKQLPRPSAKFLMEVHSKLAQSYFKLNAFISAAEEFKTGLQLAEEQADLPSALTFRQRLIETNLVMGQLEAAHGYAEPVQAEVQESDDLIVSIARFRYCLTMAEVWLALQDPIQALESCSKAREMEPFFEQQVAEGDLPLHVLKELRATRRELHGRVLGRLMAYRPGLDELEQARILWADIGDSEAANRCLLKMIDIRLRRIGDSVESLPLFEQAEEYNKSIDSNSVTETWLRLQLLRADWLERTDREEEASNLIRDLIVRSKQGWTPRMVVILTLEIAAQKGFEPLQDYELLLQALEKLQPPTARISFPGLLRRCSTIEGLPESIVNSIEKLLTEPKAGQVDYEIQALLMAETFRVLGDKERGEEWLTKAEVELGRSNSPFALLQILNSSFRIGRRLQSPERVSTLVENFLSAFKDYPTLCGAMLIGYGECLFIEEQYDTSRHQLEAAWSYLHQERETTLSRLMVRVERLNMLLAEKEGNIEAANVHSKRACKYMLQLMGDTKFCTKVMEEQLIVSAPATTASGFPREEAAGVKHIDKHSLREFQRGFVMDSEATGVKRINKDSLRKLQRGFVMDMNSLRDMAATFQIRPDESKPSLYFKLPHQKDLQIRPPKDQDSSNLLDLASADPFSQGLLNRILSDWKQTAREMGELLITSEDAAEISNLASEKNLDFRLEIADEAIASLPWEIMQFPGKPDLPSCSEKLRFFYRALLPGTVDVGEVKWVQKMLKKLIPDQAKNLIPDGVDSEETKRIVLSFQHEQNLLEDGHPGPVTIKVMKKLLRQEQMRAPRRVLILQASVEREQEIYRGDRRQGLDLADLYSRNSFRVDMLENPDVERLKDSLRSYAPEVVHICATMKNSPSVGVYLDFASDLGGKGVSLSSSDNSAFTFSALSDQLKILTDSGEPRPIVILDIARPPGITEILRQLLLRNAYASGLFRLGGISTVVATGLGTLTDQSKLNQLLIRNVAEEGEGGPIGFAVKDIRKLAEERVPLMSDKYWLNGASSDDFEQIISFIGTALFTINPFY